MSLPENTKKFESRVVFSIEVKQLYERHLLKLLSEEEKRERWQFELNYCFKDIVFFSFVVARSKGVVFCAILEHMSKEGLKITHSRRMVFTNSIFLRTSWRQEAKTYFWLVFPSLFFYYNANFSQK